MTKTLHNEIYANKCLYKPLDEESLSKMVLISSGSSVSFHTASKCKGSTIIILAVIGLLFFALLSSIFRTAPSQVNVLHVEADKPSVCVTNSKFLSIGLDASNIAEGFKNFDMGSTKLKKMMQHLSPGYLRIGGTLADRLLFITNDNNTLKRNSVPVQDGDVCAYEDETCNVNLRPNFTMSDVEWLELNQLAAETGFTILFDLNSLMRYDNGSWNSSNAEELISLSDAHNLTVVWELGNEPSAFQHVFNYSVNATQMSRDFITLRKILDRYPRYKTSLLVGPDVRRPRPENADSEKYLKQFLENSGHVLDAITWHQYYFNGRTATADDFLNPNVFNILASQADTIKDIANSYGLHDTPIWLGETAAAYGGGAPGYNNRYIGTFIWLDKLGLAAKKGLDVVVRQSIAKGFYALLDDNYDPTPDYWIGMLYKTFVGPEVVSCYSATSPKVRLYCQCSNKEFSKSSITVYGMNMQHTDAIIRMQGITSDTELSAYILTPNLSVYSKNMLLNKEVLRMDADGNPPPLKPLILPKGAPVVMPPFSTIFIVVPSNVLACSDN